MQFRNLIYAAAIGLNPHAAQSQPPKAIQTATVPGGSYLGIQAWDVSAERAKALKLPEVAGVQVTYLAPNSPAAAAGIKVDDVVMQYAGQRVDNWEQFARMVHETPPGRDVKLQIYRNGASQIVVAKLVPVPTWVSQGVSAPTQSHPLAIRSTPQDISRPRMTYEIGVLGAELESLDGQLASYFGVRDGVLVRSVNSGLAAERAGIKAGDVITRVSDAKVTTPADVSGRLRAGREQSAIVTVWRDHHEINLPIELDGNRPGEQ